MAKRLCGHRPPHPRTGRAADAGRAGGGDGRVHWPAGGRTGVGSRENRRGRDPRRAHPPQRRPAGPGRGGVRRPADGGRRVGASQPAAAPRSGRPAPQGGLCDGGRPSLGPLRRGAAHQKTEKKQDSRRLFPGYGLFREGTGPLRRARGHHLPARRRAGGHAAGRVPGRRRLGIRHQRAFRSPVLGRRRRPRGGGAARRVAQAGRATSAGPPPDRTDPHAGFSGARDRRPRPVPALLGGLYPGREGGPFALLDADAAAPRRDAPDQQHRGRHQLCHVRVRATAARLRLSPSAPQACPERLP